MNIKEFLLDNYIWILVVILLAIITVIGFLVDKKRDSSKAKVPKAPKVNNPSNSLSPNNNFGNYQNNPNTAFQGQSFNYQQTGMNMPNVNANMSGNLSNLPNNNQNVPPSVGNAMIANGGIRSLSQQVSNFNSSNGAFQQPMATMTPGANQGPQTMNQTVNQVGVNQGNMANQYNQSSMNIPPSFSMNGTNQGLQSPVPPVNHNSSSMPQSNQVTPPQPVVPQPISFVYGPKNDSSNQNRPQ